MAATNVVEHVPWTNTTEGRKSRKLPSDARAFALGSSAVKFSLLVSLINANLLYKSFLSHSETCYREGWALFFPVDRALSFLSVPSIWLGWMMATEYKGHIEGSDTAENPSQTIKCAHSVNVVLLDRLALDDLQDDISSPYRWVSGVRVATNRVAVSFHPYQRAVRKLSMSRATP